MRIELENRSVIEFIENTNDNNVRGKGTGFWHIDGKEKGAESMTKVKVSKEVAEILKHIEHISNGSLSTACQRLGSVLYNQSAVVEASTIKALKSHGDDVELFNALKFGYKAERTPEEKLLVYYEEELKKINRDVSRYTQYEGGLTDGIYNTLTILGIKIDGINQ